MSKRDKARKYALQRANAERRAATKGVGLVILGVCVAVLAALVWAAMAVVR